METISFSCPKCNFQMSAETIYCGQIVHCVQCNSEVQIPQKIRSQTLYASVETITQYKKRARLKSLLQCCQSYFGFWFCYNSVV